MNYFLFITKSALEDFSKNKTRTFLTSLGILIGVSSVILLLALGLGLKKYISNQFDSLGANLLMVMPGSKETVMRSGGIGGISFDVKDVTKISRLANVKTVAPMYAKPATKIKSNNKTEYMDLVGSSEKIVEVFNLEIEDGRLLGKKDIEKKAKVGMISAPYAKKLFGSNIDALGKYLTVENQKFKIIGVIKSKGGGGMGGSDLDAHFYVPYTATYSFNPTKKFYSIYLKSENKESIESVKKSIKSLLLKRYEEDQFSVVDQGEIMGTITSIFNILNTVLVAIAAISLIVGGVGIMNIMYVTVIERIREVGIRRSLGATEKDILTQFLSEAVLLSSIGGIAGLILSEIVVLIVQSFFPAYIDLNSVLLALGVSSAVGIIFGVFPAKKAASLSPIDAIRYE